MFTQSEKSSRLLIALAVFLLVLLLLVGGSIFLSSYQQSQKDEVHSSLQAVFDTVREAVGSWRTQEVSNVVLWAGQHGIVRMTKQLLALKRTADDLINSDVQEEIRDLLKPVYGSDIYRGFFIVAPDGTSLASSRDINTGSRNLILDIPGVFETVMKGEPLVTRPQPSDVPLFDNRIKRYRDYMPTMFAAAPIRDESNEVIAVLTFRISPEATLYPILEKGRIGESGETFIFDKNGVLLSESRFAPYFRQKGKLGKDDLSAFNIILEQDGADDEPPLIRSVSDAGNAHEGYDIEGYPGYHDETAVGIWSWLDEFGLGLAIQFNADEAYRNYRQIRTVIWASVLVISLGLSVLGFLSATHSTRLARLVEERTRELSQQRAHSQSIIDGAFDAIVTIDDAALIQSFNPAACRLFGYEQSEVLGRNVAILMPEDIGQNHDGYVEHYRHTREARLIGNARELEARRRDGSVFWIELSLTEIGAVETHRFVGFIRDITLRKQLDNEGEAYNRTLFEQSPAGLMLLSDDGCFADVNSSFAKIFGRSPDYFLNKRFIDLVVKNKQEVLKENLNSLVREGGSYGPIEIELISDDSETILVKLVGRTLMREGKPYVWSAVEDVSEQRAYEAALTEARDRAESANAAKSQFLANISHELRTPLNAVIGYSEMLQEDAEYSVNKGMIPDLQRIENSARHLMGVINDVLDISKIEAGRQELFCEYFDLNVLVHNIHPTAVVLAMKHGNQLEIEVDDRIAQMLGDEQRIRQILLNLIGNSAKFTNNGFIKLTVTLSMRKKGEWIVFEVCDTGIGMTDEQLDKVFDPFTQADGSTTRKYGGTGLGLTIVRQFTDLMGGDIEVSSKLGRGSSFTVSFPLNKECAMEKLNQRCVSVNGL
ncbi:MAG: PAS domain S-box protein [Candidatus Sedimenticola sp. 20ELBAFRAG]